MIGNKTDLSSDKRQVSIEEGIAFAKQKDFIFKEVSAKDGTNINDLFYVEIFDKISKKFGLSQPEEEINQQSNINNNINQGKIKISSLKDNKNDKKDKKKKCCK